MDNLEIQHFSHEHPLMFREEKNEEYAAAGHPLVPCCMCADPVEVGPTYSCNQCSNFIVHKSCADLPRRFIQHPAHREHQLVLQKPKKSKYDVSCEACHCGYSANNFIYCCSKCSFRLHLKCSFNLQAIIEHDNHKHKFTVNWKTMGKVSCDVCCTIVDDRPLYMCSICQLMVHMECANQLESDIKITAHHHPLKLNWLFKGNQRHCKICYRWLPNYMPQVASKSKSGTGAVYICQSCSYVAHTSCANKHRRLEDDKDCKTMVDDDNNKDDSKTLMTPIVELLQQQEQMRIKHFSHDQHLLTLQVITAESECDDTKCDGCMGSISSGDAFYICAASSPEEEESCRRFFLHKSCAQLPRQVLHPLHPHQLTLLSRVPNSLDGVFECPVCQVLSQGFAYSCSRCDFYLDIQCSIMLQSLDSVKLKHDAHIPHPLFFNAEKSGHECKGCRKKDRRFHFSCIENCSFSLCIACVKLPLTTRHRFDIHPLKLTYPSSKNRYQHKDTDDDEYYCEICEGKRDPKHLFYHCTDCDFDCHPHCVLGTSFPQIKLGGTYKLHDDVHPHPVTLVENRRSPIPEDKRNMYNDILPCGVCGEPCEGLAYVCKQCNINIHRKCPEVNHGGGGGGGGCNIL